MENRPKRGKKQLDEKHEKIIKRIGERMKEIRKEKGYKNYETFAYEKGLPRAQYGRYERGADMTLSNLMKVLDAFDMTLEDFFEGM
jgi:transcriptional regulator with XRE-family HTH domain